MLENPRRGREVRNFTTNVPKILDLKSSSEQIFSRKLTLGAPVNTLMIDVNSMTMSIGSPKKSIRHYKMSYTGLSAKLQGHPARI